MIQALRLFARPTRMLRVALALVLLAAPSFASAQTDVLVLSGGADPGAQSRELRAWVGALRRAIGATHVRRIETGDCWPEGDAACAARFTRSSRTSGILFVRILWTRAGCAPMRDATGAVRGHRMFRSATLDLLLLDAGGVTIAHQTRAAELGDADRITAARELARALSL